MWWPSFVSVLEDLWQFVLGRTSATTASTITPTSERVVALPAATQPSNIVPDTRRALVRLQTGVVYTAEHPATVEIRQSLQQYDPVLARSGTLNLDEWLLYQMLHQRLTVPALALRMTPIGVWHQTLRGLPGVSSGITPKTRALCEWSVAKDFGFAGLVVSVTPDQQIEIASVGANEPGQFMIQTLQRSEWLEYRPVFTSL